MNNIIDIDVCIIILSLLNKSEAYGYQIYKNIFDRSNNKYEIKLGDIYYCLIKLERGNFLSSYYKNNGKGIKRRYYKLTQEGKRYLKKKKLEWDVTKQILDSILVGDCDEK